MTKTKKSVSPRSSSNTIVAVDEYNKYELVPAESRTHYGEHGFSSGGVPYAFQTKKADDAWLVKSTVDGRLLGLVTDNDGDWSFSKIVRSGAPPRWLVHKVWGYKGAPAIVHETDRHLRTGSSLVEVLAAGLSVRPVPVKKTPSQLDAEIASMEPNKSSDWRSGYAFGREDAQQEMASYGRKTVRETLDQLRPNAKSDFVVGQVAGYESVLSDGARYS